MDEQGFLAKSNRSFANLINLTNEELKSQGLTVDPQIIEEKIVSPVKELYIRNLTELLESILREE